MRRARAIDWQAMPSAGLRERKVQAARGNEHRPKDRRGPSADCRSAAPKVGPAAAGRYRQAVISSSGAFKRMATLRQDREEVERSKSDALDRNQRLPGQLTWDKRPCQSHHSNGRFRPITDLSSRSTRCTLFALQREITGAYITDLSASAAMHYPQHLRMTKP